VSETVSRDQRLWGRIAALIAILLCEGLFLGVLFHLSTPREALPAGWWTDLLKYSHFVMPLGAIFGAAVFLVAGQRIRQIIQSHPPAADDHLGALLFVQLIVFGGFFLMTRAVFGPIAPVFDHPGWWVGAWLAHAVLVLALWLCALLPLRTVWAIAHDAWGVLLGGCLVGLAAWGMGYWTQPFWWTMQNSTLSGAHAILDAMDDNTFVDPVRFIIGADNFAVRISAECSGYEGIGMEIVFLSAYLWLFRKRLRFPQVLFLLPAATACVWLANMVRIALLVYIGAHYSPAIAVGGFHSYAGVVLFAGVSIAAIILAEHTSFFSKQAGETERAPGNAAAPLLVPFMAATATKLITGLFSNGGVDPLYPLSVVAAAAALWWYRRDYPRQRLGGPVAALVGGAIVFVVWKFQAAVLFGAARAGGAAPQWSAAWVICRCVGFVIVTPIIEELAFRGYLARRLVSADFQSVAYGHLTTAAIGGSAILFAALHGSYWPAGLAAGIVFAAVARRAGSLADAILAHATTNALLAAWAVVAGQWWLFS
jgi:exosortase E/protease (VPEID-CTERM system)